MSFVRIQGRHTTVPAALLLAAVQRAGRFRPRCRPAAEAAAPPLYFNFAALLHLFCWTLPKNSVVFGRYLAIDTRRVNYNCPNDAVSATRARGCNLEAQQSTHRCLPRLPGVPG